MPVGPGKRLPTEAEWEAAAAGSDRERANLDQLSFGCAPAGAYADAASDSGAVQMLGDVWEWTSSDFTPYPGFAAFPYPEYSEVFFGDSHKVLRGGAWATRRDVIRTSFRNWDLPDPPPDLRGHPLRHGRRMNNIDAAVTDRIAIQVNLPPGGPLSGMAADVRAGLTSPFKELSPRYFYDEKGSELFERITELEEYYPTRCERAILEGRSAEICEAANRPASLIELGSGSARKTRVLLDAMRDVGCLETYCPVDISEEITRDTAERIAGEYDGINVRGLVCDFEFDLERVPVGGPRVIALLGGTIGNFAPHQRAGFLRRIANLLDEEDRFLLGTDLVKDAATLEAAYNDSAGVTAEFNKNVLAVLNHELGADFDIDSFEHVARWDPENLWVDIRLRSQANQVVNVRSAGHAGPLRRGRGDAHRDLDQVPAPRARGDLRRGRPRADRLVDGPRGAVRAVVGTSGVTASPSGRDRERSPHTSRFELRPSLQSGAAWRSLTRTARESRTGCGAAPRPGPVPTGRPRREPA